MMYFIILSLAATIGLNYLLSFLMSPQKREIYYNEFVQLVEADKVDKVEIKSDRIVIYEKKDEKNSGLIDGLNEPQQTMYYTGYVNDPELKSMLEEHNKKLLRRRGLQACRVAQIRF